MRGLGDIKCLAHGGGSIRTISPPDVGFMKVHPAGSLGGVSAAGSQKTTLIRVAEEEPEPQSMMGQDGTQRD